MKVVKLSHPNYEYDVHSLVKAFYAEDQVTVITPETKPEKLAELEPQVSLEIELGDTGAKIRVGEEIFLWEAASEAIADGYKNGLKRFLYRTLSKVTGQELPWGNLTGIRPTKIAYGMLDEGRSDAEILDFMEQSHYVSEEKALLGIDIAKKWPKWWPCWANTGTNRLCILPVPTNGATPTPDWMRGASSPPPDPSIHRSCAAIRGMPLRHMRT